GETGTRGTKELRWTEASAAAQTMGVAIRRCAELPDAHLHNTDATRRNVIGHIREFRPTTVILPFPTGRHPDHIAASELGRDACFLAGLKNYDTPGEPHR